MINHPLTEHTHPLRGRIFSLFAVALIFILAFSLIQPLGSFSGVQAAGGNPPSGVDWAHGIYKKASKFILSAGDVMTYTIHLEIPLTATAVTFKADVSDPLPTGLDYAADSANASGVYDAATRTVSWSQVAVTGGSPVDLTFNVTDIATPTAPTPTVNTANITLNGLVLQRQAWVTLMPGTTILPLPGLLGSFKSASPSRLGPNDVVTYTIHLIKSGGAAASVQVSDPLPAPLSYVAGSANNGGVYNDTHKTVSWSNITVAPDAPVLLTFAAQAPAVLPDTLHPAMVTNTATITSGLVSFKRSADILLVPQPTKPPLAGSFKIASQKKVTPGEQFTYTIELNNSSDAPMPAAVTDKLPDQVTYVAGSANAGGVYDDTSRTLTWSNLSVPDGTPLTLTFDVMAESTLGPSAQPGGLLITNSAVIASGEVTLTRSTQVWLAPTPTGDNTPPVVDSFTIGDTDVFTSPDVTLNISAHDNVAVTSMYLVEWVLSSKPVPHWQSVKTSGWIPYQTTYTWTLSSQSGTHYIGVWVADAAMNKSKLTRASIDFASLILPGSQVSQGQMTPYLVYYPAGVAVTAVLTPTTGEAHLHLWQPGNMFAPDHSSTLPGDVTQTITFTTHTAGTYMFLVYGKTDAVFDLSITPGGGPQAGTSASAAAVSSFSAPSLPDASLASSAADDGMTYNPILPQSGLDPLNVATDPLFNQVYLPAMER